MKDDRRRELAMIRRVKAVARHGHLELLEPLELPEGATLEVTLDVPAQSTKTSPGRVHRRPAWNLGVKGPLTRDAIYDDLT